MELCWEIHTTATTAHLMSSIKVSRATTYWAGVDVYTADCEVGPQAAKDSNEILGLEDNGLRQKKGPSSASFQHKSAQMTKLVHEEGWRELMTGGDDMRHHQWQQKGSTGEEGHPCHPGSPNLDLPQ